MFTILIDTSAYEVHGLSFVGGVFDPLLKLADESKIKIVSCSIINREIESHISLSVSQSVNKVEKACKGFDHITKNNLGIITESIKDAESLKQTITTNRIAAFSNFLTDANVEELDLSNIDLKKVLSDYFDAKAPFSNGKKKNEFPDAFILNSFINENLESLNQACLVSNDPDWRKFANEFPEIQLFDTISDLLDFIHNDYDAAFTNQLKDAIQQKYHEIESSITEIIQDWFEFDFDDQWLEPEAEIDQSSVSVRIIDANILDFDSETSQCELEVKIAYRLEVSDLDGDSWMKDYETKDIIYAGSNTYEVRANKTVTVKLYASYEPHSIAATIDFQDITLPDDLFYIDSEDDDLKIAVISQWDEDY